MAVMGSDVSVAACMCALVSMIIVRYNVCVDFDGCCISSNPSHACSMQLKNEAVERDAMTRVCLDIQTDYIRKMVVK